MGTAHIGICNRLSGSSEHLRSQGFRSWGLDLPCEMSFAASLFPSIFYLLACILDYCSRVEKPLCDN